MVYREPPSLCARHPLSAAVAVCAQCRARICESCAVWVGLAARCSACAARRRRIHEVARAAGWCSYAGFVVLIGIVIGALVWVWPAKPRCDDFDCWAREAHARMPRQPPPERVVRPRHIYRARSDGDPLCPGCDPENVLGGLVGVSNRAENSCTHIHYCDGRVLRVGCDADNVLGGLVGVSDPR
jgi:hypothetical protein